MVDYLFWLGLWTEEIHFKSEISCQETALAKSHLVGEAEVEN